MQVQFSESISKLAASMLAAQSQMENAKTKATNPHFRSKYADLAEVLEVAKKPLLENGLSVMQFPLSDTNFQDQVGVETMIVHTSGEWVCSKLTLPIKKVDPQGAGSAITYARRYALAAVLAIAQEDDDGQSHYQPETVQGTDAEWELLKQLHDKKEFDREAFLSAFRITDPNQLEGRHEDIRKAINALSKKADR
jgi:hypothetical protein